MDNKTKKYIKCKELHFKKSIKNNKELYKKYLDITKKKNNNLTIDLSKNILINMIKKQIKKEKNKDKKKELQKTLKNTIIFQKKNMKKVKNSNTKKNKITSQDKLIETKWKSILDNNKC